MISLISTRTRKLVTHKKKSSWQSAVCVSTASKPRVVPVGGGGRGQSLHSSNRAHGSSTFGCHTVTLSPPPQKKNTVLVVYFHLKFEINANIFHQSESFHPRPRPHPTPHPHWGFDVVETFLLGNFSGKLAEVFKIPVH